MDQKPKERNYICTNCEYKKVSTKLPEEFKRCPYCGKETFIEDNMTAEKLVREIE